MPKFYKTTPLDIATIKDGQWVTILGPNMRFFQAKKLSDDPDGSHNSWSVDPEIKIAIHPGTDRFHQLVGIPLQVVDVMDPLISVCCFNSFLIPICVRIIDTRSLAVGPCSRRWVSRFFRAASAIENIKERVANTPRASEGVPVQAEYAGFGSPPYHDIDPKTLHLQAIPPDLNELSSKPPLDDEEDDDPDHQEQ